MQISAEKLADDLTRIALEGRLDIPGTQAIETSLAAHLSANRGGFILDLSRVTFLASIGVRAILMSAKALQARGGKAAILDPVPEVARVLSLTGVDTVIPVCSGLDAARAAVAAA